MQTPAIVMSYDDSPDSRRALLWAADEAAETTSPLRVLTVEDVQARPTAPGAAGSVPSPVPHALDNARGLLEARNMRSVSFEHRVGRVVSVLLDAAESASCVVLGSQGHGRFGETFRGSVSHYVARHATCPVVVVRPPRVGAATAVVVGVDGSPQSVAALEYACARAERTLERVLAVSVLPRADISGIGERYEVRANGDLDRMTQTVAVAVAAARLKHPDVDVQAQHNSGDPVGTLVETSRVASLLVVGSRGRGFVNGLLLGSVSQGVLHRARCPVAVVR